MRETSESEHSGKSGRDGESVRGRGSWSWLVSWIMPCCGSGSNCWQNEINKFSENQLKYTISMSQCVCVCEYCLCLLCKLKYLSICGFDKIKFVAHPHPHTHIHSEAVHSLPFACFAGCNRICLCICVCVSWGIYFNLFIWLIKIVVSAAFN